MKDKTAARAADTLTHLTSQADERKYGYRHGHRPSTGKDHFLSTQPHRTQRGELNVLSDPSQKQIASMEELPNAVHSNSLRTGGGLSTDRSPGLVQYNNWYVARQSGNGLARAETQGKEQQSCERNDKFK